MQKKVFIKTFGCQMNEYDSDKMADVPGASDGLVRTENPEDADVILLNTKVERILVDRPSRKGGGELKGRTSTRRQIVFHPITHCVANLSPTRTT
jgi:hypothetical protein